MFAEIRLGIRPARDERRLRSRLADNYARWKLKTNFWVRACITSKSRNSRANEDNIERHNPGEPLEKPTRRLSEAYGYIRERRTYARIYLNIRSRPCIWGLYIIQIIVVYIGFPGSCYDSLKCIKYTQKSMETPAGASIPWNNDVFPSVS